MQKNDPYNNRLFFFQFGALNDAFVADFHALVQTHLWRRIHMLSIRISRPTEMG